MRNSSDAAGGHLGSVKLQEVGSAFRMMSFMRSSSGMAPNSSKFMSAALILLVRQSNDSPGFNINDPKALHW